MLIIHQFEFDFTFPLARADARQSGSWRVGVLARRYRLSPAQAALYAAEMRLPVEGAWS